MTIKNILRIVGGAIVAFLFAILGLQRKKIARQKEDIKEKEKEVEKAEKTAQDAHKTTKIIKDESKVENSIRKQETDNAIKIEGADNEKELVDIGNAIIDDFNKHDKL